MKKTSMMTALILTLFICLSGCVSMNPSNDKVQVQTDSIVSTSVAICQILDKLEYNNVIGIPETSNILPDHYKNATVVGAPMNPDFEIIKSLSPDLVLTPKSLESTLSKDYTSAGINSAFLDLSSVEGMYKAINSLGKLLACEEKAQALIAEYESYMAGYSAKNSGQPSILLIMAFPDGFYLVATENSYVGNLVKLAGGKNVYGDSYNGDENGFININPEDMVQKDPDMILVFAHYAEKDAFSFMKNEFISNKAWQYYDAVTQGKVYYLPSEYFGMSATLSWTKGLDYLEPILFGE